MRHHAAVDRDVRPGHRPRTRPGARAPAVVITISGTIGPDVRGPATNSATVTSPISAPATADQSSDVVAVGDLAITKVPDATEVAAGATAGFSLVVTNAGPSDAVATEVGDLLPPGITFDPEQSDPTCALVDTPMGPFVSCAIGTLAAGETRTVRVAGRVDPGQPPGELVNRAAASSPITGEFDFANNLSEVPITVVQSADLAVSKVADAESVTRRRPGDLHRRRHQRRAVARDRRRGHRRDPRGPRRSSSAPAGCSVAGATVTCTAPTLEAGATATYPIVLEVPRGRRARGGRQHRHRRRRPRPTPTPPTTSRRRPSRWSSASDVAITKTLVTDPVVAGPPVTYELSVTNNGPNDAPDVVISDTLPAGTTFVSAVPPAGGACSVVPEDGLTSSAARSTSCPWARPAPPP